MYELSPQEPQSIIRLTRKNIFDGLQLRKIRWQGCMSDAEFLERVFDLENLPSNDSRYSNATGDIWQHTCNNDDWPDNWVFSDRRFNLLGCTDDLFVTFLEELLHPLVRGDADEVTMLLKHINDQLSEDGWVLVPHASIGGHPTFKGIKKSGLENGLRQVQDAANSFGASWMHREITRAQKAIDTDPELAIGTAKEMIETCCKNVLYKIDSNLTPEGDFPKLVKQTIRHLKLTKDDIPDEAKGADIIRVILNNLTAVTRGVNELRNLYGTGHGRLGNYKGLDVRHANLAVGAATTFVLFISETFEARHVRDVS